MFQLLQRFRFENEFYLAIGFASLYVPENQSHRTGLTVLVASRGKSYENIVLIALKPVAPVQPLEPVHLAYRKCEVGVCITVFEQFIKEQVTPFFDAVVLCHVPSSLKISLEFGMQN